MVYRTHTRLARIAGSLAILFCPLLTAFGGATTIPWHDGPFTYMADGVEIPELLRTLGGAQGIAIVISPGVTGKINASFVDVAPGEVFNCIVSAYGLTWYYDGAVLYVYATGEVRTELIELNLLSPDRAVEIIKELGLYDTRYAIRTLKEPPMLYISGPPCYLDKVRSVIHGADARLSQQEVRKEEVRYFKLKHAWAADMSLSLREGQTKIPGIATLLSRLMENRHQGGTNVPVAIESGETPTGARESLSTPTRLPGGESGGAAPTPDGVALRNPAGGADLAGDTTANATTPTETSVNNTPPARLKNQLNSYFEPSIEADTRNNAVVVRDSAARMALYESLIEKLDIVVRLVEIQASIIDVNADVAFDWGVQAELSYQDNHNEGSTLFNTNGTLSDTGTDNSLSGLTSGALDVGQGNASWLVFNDHLRFLTAIKALEGRGKARILSRPSLITFANQEAELRDDQTYNVRVAGEREAKLYSVTAGVLLAVTANIIDPDEGDEHGGIQLVVHIEDGDFDESTVEGLPMVRNSAINTQAIVRANQSLLVGGYLRDVHTKNRKGVPVLSKIPAVGGVFRSRSEKRGVMQRMFLLTPRIIELDAAAPKSLVGAPVGNANDQKIFNMLEEKLPDTLKENPEAKKKKADTKESASPTKKKPNFRRNPKAVEEAQDVR